MKVFIHPHEGNTAEVESWNITKEEPEQVMVVRNGRAYVLLFEETVKLEVWNTDEFGEMGEVLQEIEIPAIHEQLEFGFVKNL